MACPDAERSYRKLEILESIIERLMKLRRRPLAVLERKLLAMEDLIADFPRGSLRFRLWKDTVAHLWERFCTEEEDEAHSDDHVSPPPKTTMMTRRPSPPGKITTNNSDSNLSEHQTIPKTIMESSNPSRAVPTTTTTRPPPIISDPALAALLDQLATSILDLAPVRSSVDIEPLSLLSTAVSESLQILKPHLANFTAQRRILDTALGKLPASMAGQFCGQKKMGLKTMAHFLARHLELASAQGPSSNANSSTDE